MIQHLEVEQKLEELLFQLHPGNKNEREVIKQLQIEEKLALFLLREDKKTK